MDATKAAWLASREPYGQTEVYRFRVGPIDALMADGMLDGTTTSRQSRRRGT